MGSSLNNKDSCCLYEKNNQCNCMNSYKNVFIVNGTKKSKMIDLPITEEKSMKSIIVDAINIDTSCCYDTNIKLEFNLNIFKGKGMTISKINFQVFKICDNESCKLPVGETFVYINNNSNESMNLLNITLYDKVCNSKRCIYLLEAIL